MAQATSGNSLLHNEQYDIAKGRSTTDAGTRKMKLEFSDIPPKRLIEYTTTRLCVNYFIGLQSEAVNVTDSYLHNRCQ